MDSEQYRAMITGLLAGFVFAISASGFYGPFHLLRGDVISGLYCLIAPPTLLLYLAFDLHDEPKRWRVVVPAVLIYFAALVLGGIAGSWHGVPA